MKVALIHKMIDLAEFTRLSREFNVVPVSKRLFSGGETALSLFDRLAPTEEACFLLESAEQGIWGRFSFIGLKSRGVLVGEELGVRWIGEAKALPIGQLDESPLAALRQLTAAWQSAPSEYPLTAGLVGFSSWGLVHEIETLPDFKEADYQLPVIYFNQFSELLVVDHERGEIVLVSVQFMDGVGSIEEKHKAALLAIAKLEERLGEPYRTNWGTPNWPDPLPRLRTRPDDFIESVEVAKRHVAAGDVFQVVLSQRFDLDCSASDLGVYKALRTLNPSPYMYLLRGFVEGDAFAIVGSSPEALVTVTDRKAVMHPIAGSRPRGATGELDEDFAESLRNDAKEQSEHLMLVDLARNDLLKVCEPESLRVTEFMQVHRFSHVMHLVSTVEGTLQEGKSAVDALEASFPAGTLSGAPKPRALELIHELEPVSRGLFGGVVGYFDFHGNSDLAIAIRTAVIKEGKAYVQAGAGIVLDSIPQSEYAETQSKSAAVLRAIAAANAMSL